jgi:hypothetical protein
VTFALTTVALVVRAASRADDGVFLPLEELRERAERAASEGGTGWPTAGTWARRT